MAYRRIIQLSPTTKVVSLPSDWLKKNRIKKGDSVSVEEKNNRIIIEAEYSESPSCSIDVTALEEDLLWMAADTLYILGYDDISMRLSHEQKLLMFKVIKFFPMFVIASESKNHVELKAVSKSLDIDFNNTLQRIRHLTLMMIDDGLSSASGKEVKKLDYTLNTHISMCFRYLSTSPNNAASNVAWAQFVKILELFADRICIMFEDAETVKTSKKDRAMILEIKELYNNSFKILEKFSMESLNAHENSRKSLESRSKGSIISMNIKELARSLFDMEEIIFQISEIKKKEK